jgi:hypothetical protein
LAETYASIGRLDDALQVTELLDLEEQQDSIQANRIHVGVGDDPTPSKYLRRSKTIRCAYSARSPCNSPGRAAIVKLADHLLSNAAAELPKSNGPSNEQDASPNWPRLMNCASSRPVRETLFTLGDRYQRKLFSGAL